ncbi:hypothetical protein CJD38_05690 [Stenotrophobium rhamnosiphilum]|uniref:Uncharacterized protein n=1 Tax=Stenotrophobium rhamnosiphilum TaxID=2029166 RepID=A0A2T5MHT7_9GAMM|nr:hypothetical protein CJD38_05690 [Stenotrophobium rhamnosiphilum]
MSGQGCPVTHPGQDEKHRELPRLFVGARTQGVFSLVTFFAQAKKVTRTACETRHFKEQQALAQKTNWMPAYAGMTDKKRNAPCGAFLSYSIPLATVRQQIN